jgi:hypothetical protein
VKKIEDPDMNPGSYAHIILTTFPKTHDGEKANSLFKKCCWEKWLSECRKLKLHPCLSLCTSINSKWIKFLNIRPKPLKLVLERTGNTLEATGIGKDFLSRTQVTQ